MSLCFFIKDHQDLDHFIPIINFLKKENKIIIFLENEKLIDDNRIKYISEFIEIEIFKKKNKYFNYFKYLIFKYSLVTKLLFFFINIFSKINIFNLLFQNHFLLKKKIKAIVYDHRPPENCYYIFLCKLFKIKLISMPHGYHIFTDKIDFLESQKNRNIFDYYTVQADFQKKHLTSLGMREDKIVVLGSPRFEERWVNNLNKIHLNQTNKFKNKNPVLSIFLGHWKYGIDRSETMNLIRNITSLGIFNIVLNLHTRGTSELELNEINEFKKNENLMINSSYPASKVIELSDVIIGVGTSVLLECITKGKCFFYLGYLQKYKTIFDQINNSQITTSNIDVVKKIKNFNDKKKEFIDSKSNFYSKFVKNNHTSLEELHKTFFNKNIF